MFALKSISFNTLASHARFIFPDPPNGEGFEPQRKEELSGMWHEAVSDGEATGIEFREVLGTPSLLFFQGSTLIRIFCCCFVLNGIYTFFKIHPSTRTVVVISNP